MTQPHPALVDIVAGRGPATVGDSEDAAELVRSALEHHVFGLLWTEVHEGHLRLPRRLEQQLAVQDLLTQNRHTKLWQTIDTISEALGSLGVEFAVIKGVPAEARWYDRLGERPCADVDVFLDPRDALRATAIVHALDPHRRLDGDVEAEYQRGLVHGIDLHINEVAVDLHLDPLKIGLLGRDRTALWERTTAFTTPSGTTIRVLDAEAALFHFLVVMNKDGFCRLLGFADIARLLRRESIDWDRFAALTHSYGLDVVSRSALLAVAETLGVDVPVAAPRGVRAAAWQHLWPQPVRLRGDLGWAHYRRRVYALPALSERAAADAARWWWRRLVLAPSVANRANPDGRGPWFWRILTGRVHRWRERRAVVRALR